MSKRYAKSLRGKKRSSANLTNGRGLSYLMKSRLYGGSWLKVDMRGPPSGSAPTKSAADERPHASQRCAMDNAVGPALSKAL
eukprot:616221-Amphidinium_carterae.1